MTLTSTVLSPASPHLVVVFMASKPTVQAEMETLSLYQINDL
jgi:hypothetical protein